MMNIKAYGTEAAEAPLKLLNIQRRDVTPHDVEIEILYCGICHSDLHAARNEWHNTVYPIVPGHEIVGRVTSVGDQITKFKVGDLAAVGCIVDSCRECEYCKEGLEQFCEPGNTIVFGSPDKYLGGQTYGGYSEIIVVDENYVLRVPENLDPAAAAPLLCGGITTYSPLKHWNVGPGKKVGIVGIGGLGHLARNNDVSKCRIVEGDVLDSNQLKEAITGQDIVYANLSGDLEAMAINIVKAMEETGVKKLIAKIIESPEKYIRENLSVNKPNS